MLADHIRELAAETGAEPLVHELIPGIPFQEQVPPPKQDGSYNTLIIGRTDDPLKGVMEAAEMIRNLNEGGLDVSLNVRGAAPETLERTQMILSNAAGRQVTVKPYTSDRAEMMADLRETNLVIMPSRGESFGLVAIEALAAGVPLLISVTSGAGRFVTDPSRFGDGIGNRMVVEQDFDGPIPVSVWIERIRAELLDNANAWVDAAAIRNTLMANEVTWTSAAKSLLESVDARRASR